MTGGLSVPATRGGQWEYKARHSTRGPAWTATRWAKESEKCRKSAQRKGMWWVFGPSIGIAVECGYRPDENTIWGEPRRVGTL